MDPDKQEQKKQDDDLNIDFKDIKNKAKKFFSSLSERDKTAKKPDEEQKERSETHTTSHHKNKEEKTKDDELKIDMNKIKDTGKKIAKQCRTQDPIRINPKIVIWSLIIIILIVSTIFRLYPAHLPITNEIAENNIRQGIRNSIESQILQQNPNLPQTQARELANQQVDEYINQNKAGIEQQKEQLANQLKERFQNDAGQTYLIAIDPYLWYSYAKWYEKTGYFGNEVVNGEERFTLRNGQIGMPARFILPSYIIVIVHNIISIFNSNADIMSTTFYLPVLLMGLGIIPAFFLGRKFGGIGGGLFGASIFALAPAILGRTTAGFSDTDAYTLMIPFIIVWLMLESLEAEKLKWKIALAGLAGLSVIILKHIWAGYWFITDFALGMPVLYAVFLLGTEMHKKIETKNRKKIRMYVGIGSVILLLMLASVQTGILRGLEVAVMVTAMIAVLAYLVLIAIDYFRNQHKENKIEIWKLVKPSTYTLGIFILGVLLFGALFAPALQRSPIQEIGGLLDTPLIPLEFIVGFKAAASDVTIGGDYALWPNVLTTVAELNEAGRGQIIQGGGGSFKLSLAILGILFAFFRFNENKKYSFYSIIIGAWFLSTYFASTTGVRFIALFSPVVGFGVALLIGVLTGKQLQKQMQKIKFNYHYASILVVIIMSLILLVPLIGDANQIAKNELPSMSDAWWESLELINQNSTQAIITSWWDFGHWFQAVSERSVTFDGGDQEKRIHWVGLSLLTAEEDETIDILNMLNCGQEVSYDKLVEYTKDKLRATLLLKEIIRQNKNQAKQTLLDAGLTSTQADDVLNYTHCDNLVDQYYITSEDMVGKAGVWGHFGSWDFTKAYFYYNLKRKTAEQAISLAQSELGMSREDATKLFAEVQKIDNEDEANVWISGFPGYLTGDAKACVYDNATQTVGCEVSVGLGTTAQGYYQQLWRVTIPLNNINETQYMLRQIDRTTNTLLGQVQLKPNAVVVSREGARNLQRYDIGGEEIPFDVLLIQTGNTYKALITQPELTESMFTKLFFLEGRHTQNFELLSEKTSHNGELIQVWKLNRP